ncbi:MAG: EAL domain-containing protein, partial [Myxococcota bacterium]
HIEFDDLWDQLGDVHEVRVAGSEVVELDMGLIRDLHISKRKQEIIRAMCTMCEELGAKVVAEGIETVDELQAVIDCGAHYGQGYLLARPAKPAPEVEWPREPLEVAQ